MYKVANIVGMCRMIPKYNSTHKIKLQETKPYKCILESVDNSEKNSVWRKVYKFHFHYKLQAIDKVYKQSKIKFESQTFTEHLLQVSESFKCKYMKRVQDSVEIISTEKKLSAMLQEDRKIP